MADGSKKPDLEKALGLVFDKYGITNINNPVRILSACRYEPETFAFMFWRIYRSPYSCGHVYKREASRGVRIMHLTSDDVVVWHYGFVKLNLTILTTWVLMLILVGGSALMTRKLSDGIRISRWQSFLEILVTFFLQQFEEVGLPNPARYLPYLATLFLFIAIANLCTVVPGYEPPTGSLSTTAALALSVFIAVPLYGIRERGLGNFLQSYLKPTVIMLPFNIISEFSRTLALAVRLFGNMMSGAMILAILLTIAPLVFPLLMSILGLLTGMVQAYIFCILATVYIAAATRTRDEETV